MKLRPHGSIAVLLVLLMMALARPSVAAEDRTSYFRDVVVQEGEKSADVLCIYCSVRLNGVAEGDAVAIGGDVELTGSVKGDVVTIGGRIRLHSGTEIEGDAIAIGGWLERAAPSKVGGDAQALPWAYIPGQRRPVLLGGAIYAAVWIGLALLSCGVVRPRRAEAMAATCREHPWRSFLFGLLTVAIFWALYYATPYAKRHEDQLDWIITGTWMLVCVYGLPGPCLRIGSELVPGRGVFAGVLSGALMIAALQFIPVLGALAFLVFLFLAAGCAVTSRFGGAPRAASAG